jgi:hypothetical protein
LTLVRLTLPGTIAPSVLTTVVAGVGAGIAA